MTKRFRCGRLTVTKDGKIKKLELEDGGGSRFCQWDSIDMDFDSIHHSLIDIFKLDSKLKTSLYDFRHQLLDINKYKTLFEYINQNGLNISSTIIYICTHHVDDNDNQTRIVKKRSKTSPISMPSSMTNASNSQQKVSNLTKTTSSTSIDNKHINKNEEEFNQGKIDLFNVYSFEKSNKDLINNIRSFIRQYGLDSILLQFFEYICIIEGYVHSTIHPLNQQIEHFIQNFDLYKQSEIDFYSKNLNDVYNICRSAKTLINVNKKKFDHIEQFSIIINSCSEFYTNLKILYNNWFEHVEKNNNNNKYNTLSSSLIHPIESISSNSNIKSSSEYSNEINVENFKEQLQTSSSSSNKSAPLLSTRKLFDNEAGAKFLLFRQLLTRFNDLSQILKKHKLSSYYQMVELTTSKIKNIRSHIDLSNGLSMLKAKTIFY
ncbi:unnamed protein product [Rotaria sp. Silwood2]|nr:unnamed protein product [Rotaria sp. Silwood2]